MLLLLLLVHPDTRSSASSRDLTMHHRQLQLQLLLIHPDTRSSASSRDLTMYHRLLQLGNGAALRHYSAAITVKCCMP